MKKWHSIVIVLVVLAILTGSYFYIKQNPKQSEEETTTANEKIEITKFDTETINKIELVSDERNLTITKQDDKWVLDGKTDIEANQSTINSMANSLSNISSTLLVEENVLEFSAYGLDNPHKAIITLADGSIHTFLLGNPAPTGEGYYFMKDGEKTVYMVSNSYKTNLYYTFEDLVQKEDIPTITVENLNYFYVSQKDKRPIEIIKLDADKNYKYELWNSLSLWSMTKPYKLQRGVAGNESWDSIVNATNGFNNAVKKFVANNPNDLSIYGLDNPNLEILLKDSDNVETHLYFGNAADENTIYFKQANSSNVYTMSKSAIEKFENIDVFSITDKFAILFNIEDLDKLIINNGNETTEFDITITKTTEGEGESARQLTSVGCTVDGKEYPEDDFKKFYQNVIGLSIDSEYNGEVVTGTPDISVQLQLSDGKTIEAKFYKYDDNFYIFDREGTQEFLISKRQLDNMFQRMQDFFDGTIIKED